MIIDSYWLIATDGLSFVVDYKLLDSVSRFRFLFLCVLLGFGFEFMLL